MQLPPGVTPEQMAAMVQFFASQPPAEKPRPSGTLQKHQIRGLNPNYRWTNQQYPKALHPPAQEIQSRDAEVRFRLAFNRPLHWDLTKPEGRMYTDQYWALQVYPKMMQPPQVIVQNVQEEEAVLASWRINTGSETLGGVVYPRWMFHAEKQPAMVSSADAEHALGTGWFPTPQEAVDAARGLAPAKSEQELDRNALLAKAEELGIKFDRRWPTERLRASVQAAEKTETEAA